MRSGARINAKFLMPQFRKVNFRKCVVCGKALHPRNKSGLCSADLTKEGVLNWRYQGHYNQWKKNHDLLRDTLGADSYKCLDPPAP